MPWEELVDAKEEMVKAISQIDIDNFKFDNDDDSVLVKKASLRAKALMIDAAKNIQLKDLN